MMALAFMAGIVHWTALGRREQRPAAQAADLAFWIMISGIVGARVAYVLSDLDYFRAAPWLVFRVDQGGLIYYGGFIGAVLTLAFFAQSHHERLAAFGDFVITALPLGHALGRIGCFLNGCCYGRPAPAGWRLWTGGLDRVPVQLYEAVFNLAVYALLTWFYVRRRRGRQGMVLALYLLTYPVGRFLLEFLRGDDRLRWGAFTAAQAISLSLFAIGFAVLFAARRTHDQTHRTA
jgi:phosphatidylglycerol---prolipoprotein diacylglyceryl transferase